MGQAASNIFRAFVRGALEADTLGGALEDLSSASLPDLVALVKGLESEGRLTEQAMRAIGIRAKELRGSRR